MTPPWVFFYISFCDSDMSYATFAQYFLFYIFIKTNVYAGIYFTMALMAGDATFIVWYCFWQWKFQTDAALFRSKFLFLDVLQYIQGSVLQYRIVRYIGYINYFRKHFKRNTSTGHIALLANSLVKPRLLFSRCLFCFCSPNKILFSVEFITYASASFAIDNGILLRFMRFQGGRNQGPFFCTFNDQSPTFSHFQ